MEKTKQAGQDKHIMPTVISWWFWVVFGPGLFVVIESSTNASATQSIIE